MSGSEYADGGIQNYDTEEIIDGVTELLQDRVDWHGFVTKDCVARYFNDGGVVWAHRGGDIACAAVFNHLEQRPHTRFYYTAMAEEYWDSQMWESLVQRVVRDSPHGRVLAKSVAGEAEDDLWASIAAKVGEEPSKHRRLNVWLLDETDYGDIREW